MYQTVGHTVLPLYSTALGIPLYRQQISGSALNAEKDYSHPVPTGAGAGEAEDETESLIPLLQKVLAAHPEANALSTGAILSTYQRTRIESVALRLGLVPLSYLWQYPSLPTPIPSPAGLLRDMAAVGLDARIIKVASGGLDESFLWENVCDERVIRRLERAVARFGGSVLGEGGEFETVVLVGPEGVWKGRIVVEEGERRVRRGSRGEALLELGLGEVVINDSANLREIGDWRARLKVPELWDKQFAELLPHVLATRVEDKMGSTALLATVPWQVEPSTYQHGPILKISNINSGLPNKTIEEQMVHITTKLEQTLHSHNRSPADIIFTTILLHSMTDFASANTIYSQLFPTPNPPARVTIACGNMLPAHTAVSLSCITNTDPGAHRLGLHVQSRSYWAPANIGPYSQAISLTTANEASLVYVAGQIPLVPSSMQPLAAANPSESSLGLFKRQAALSLQHLWRIGLCTDVGFWTGAIAFVVGQDAKSKAGIASALWKRVHRKPSDEEVGEEEVDGLDAWDRKYGGGSAQFAVSEPPRRPLPDFASVVAAEEDCTPGFFAVLVEGLPRGCEVEWQSMGSVNSRVSMDSDSVGGWRARRCRLVDAGHTITFVEVPELDSESAVDVREGASLGRFREMVQGMVTECQLILYTTRPADFSSCGAQIVPCRRVWDGDGLELVVGLVIHSMP